MDQEPKLSGDILRQKISVAKKLAEGIAVAVLDALNPNTPPGFELYLWSEYSKVEGHQLAFRYFKEETLPRFFRSLYAQKLARGILIEKRQLGDLNQFRQLVLEITEGKTPVGDISTP